MIQNKKTSENACGADLAETSLAEGYQGKILLMIVIGGADHGKVILRSNDLWHREILRNTVLELENMNRQESLVLPLGGAYVRFDPDGRIFIHGTSDDYGECDKSLAAKLIKRQFPPYDIIIER